MNTRREFLAKSSLLMAAAAAAGARAAPPVVSMPAVASRMPDRSTPWDEIARSFVLDRDVLCMNHASASSLPRPVFDAVLGLTHEVERLPAYLIFRGGSAVELIREEFARMYACDKEEIAIVRSATEALQAVLLGYPLSRGDEVLTTTLDYWAMLDALDQREKRDGAVIRKVKVPTPPRSADELVQAFEAGINDRTRLILISHPINLNGLLFPIARICRMAHKRNIDVVVDAAQSFGQIELTAGELGCDYMGTSLHKWMMGPKGTGLLYVKKEKIGKIWPLFAAGRTKEPDDIRKFEMYGTAPLTTLGLAAALEFHRAVGAKRISDRLKELTLMWVNQLKGIDRLRFLTSFEPGMSHALVSIDMDGVASADLFDLLLKKENVLTMNVGKRTKEFKGIRVSVGLATTPDEIDRFVAIIRRLARDLPVSHA